MCPRVNDDQKIDVDNQKLCSGRPHDYWILERLFYTILHFSYLFHWLYCSAKDNMHLRTTANPCGRPGLNISCPLTTRFSVEFT